VFVVIDDGGWGVVVVVDKDMFMGVCTKMWDEDEYKIED
jgi:hypothetical protein